MDSLDLFPAYGSVVDKFAPAPKGVPTFVSFPHVIRDGSVSPGQQVVTGAEGLRWYMPGAVVEDGYEPRDGVPALLLSRKYAHLAPEGASPEATYSFHDQLIYELYFAPDGAR